MGVSKEIDPLYRVAVQLKIFTAVGTAMRKEIKEKTMLAYIDWPVVNRWCPQTRKPRRAIARLEKATKV
jgi:hypothetical protein